MYMNVPNRTTGNTSTSSGPSELLAFIHNLITDLMIGRIRCEPAELIPFIIHNYLKRYIELTFIKDGYETTNFYLSDFDAC